MSIFGTWLPFIGWREHDEETIDAIAFDAGLDRSRRYSGFQIAWLDYVFGWGLKDIGPREHTQDV